MKRILILFFVLIPGVLFAQINPAMIQQGIGTLVGLKNKASEMKSKTNACKFSPSDKTFVYTLMVEYNKEQLAKESEDDKDSVWKKDVELDFDEKGEPTPCASCIPGVLNKVITESKDIKNRAMARAILNKMSEWSTTDYTPDELERRNRITNKTACAGQAIKVLGGMKEQILSPLLGSIMPGAGGMLQGGGGGGIGGMLGGLGGMLGGGGQ